MIILPDVVDFWGVSDLGDGTISLQWMAEDDAIETQLIMPEAEAMKLFAHLYHWASQKHDGPVSTPPSR